MAVAHEIGHSIDDQGAKYDETEPKERMIKKIH